MALILKTSTKFERDLRKMKRQGRDLSKLKKIIDKLLIEEPLEYSSRDHRLVGNWKGYRECHVQPDWLLIYRVDGNLLLLARTGSHAELFG